MDERKGKVEEVRFFSGLSVEEAASVVNVSIETVMRDWIVDSVANTVEVHRLAGSCYRYYCRSRARSSSACLGVKRSQPRPSAWKSSSVQEARMMPLPECA